MQANCPRHVVVGNRGFNQAGNGRAPGSLAYVSPATGEVIEMFFGEVIQVGHLYGLCRVANNPGLPMVRVDNALLNGSRPLQLGMVVLMGPVEFLPAGPRAKAAWPAEIKRPAPPIRPASNERLGAIRAVKQGFGFIRPTDGSADVFWHISELRGFTPYIGMPVQYTPVFDSRGTQARDVRPA